MNLCRTLCVLGMLLFAGAGKAAELLRTEGNVPIEIAFTAQRPHADPFHEVTLDVQVTAPDGTAKNVPAFWAGGAVWKVRYASPQTGLHRWRTACTDAEDAGLHGVEGTLDVQPYRGENPLYRPGPMDLIPDYIDRKHGRQKVEYLDPRLVPILGPTYGVMVYQEQVMQIAQVIGGYSLGGADLLRRAMGKKKPEEMAQQREIFVAGAVQNGVAPAKATELFNQMEKFAGYGFNKSHAAAYALVAYQTAYFKAHHAAAFMAANLSLVMDDTDKVRSLYADAAEQGLEILPPDVNASAWRFEPVDTRRIRYGLGGIKGTGEQAIASVVAARTAGGQPVILAVLPRVLEAAATAGLTPITLRSALEMSAP